MRRRVKVYFLLLLMMSILSGCLLVDRSTTLISSQDKKEIQSEAKKLVEDFFIYNQYDPESDYTLDIEKLVGLSDSDKGLFDPDKGDLEEVLTIKEMHGGSDTKRFNKLREELKEQATIFERQRDGYRLVFEDEEGNRSYSFRFLDNGDYFSRSAIFDIDFVVYEEVEGEMKDTDNGIITFELINTYRGWKIDHLTIDYQEPGTITIRN
ncbi:hypothetical protein [Halonatronum saccharophilum]|uniref:hypothetical protein n=1 Tax=Halonatronum saccharophilum TaxID=150060 RepID=UPI000488D6A1|nr:hypothetical protein [Halonatronum saccharophilum]